MPKQQTLEERVEKLEARNRRVVLPLLAGLTVACAALTVNGVMSASFGEREARRAAEVARTGAPTATAGTASGQALPSSYWSWRPSC